MEAAMIDRLINPSRRGTMIIGAYRLGSHFLHDLCCSRAREQGLDVVAHDELVGPSGAGTDPEVFLQQLISIVSAPGYHVLVLNELNQKSDLLSNPVVLDDWHVIRLIDDDKQRWFKSWFFYLHSSDQLKHMQDLVDQNSQLDGQEVLVDRMDDIEHYYHRFSLQYIKSRSRNNGYYVDQSLLGTELSKVRTILHHGTPEEVYRSFIKLIGGTIPIKQVLEQLAHALNNQLVSMVLPVDVEMQFSSLAALANESVRWTPNQYPDIDIKETFEHGQLIQTILDRWSLPFEGRFKKLK